MALVFFAWLLLPAAAGFFVGNAVGGHSSGILAIFGGIVGIAGAVAHAGFVYRRHTSAKIYQGGRAVGEVTGSVVQEDRTTWLFAQISNTGPLRAKDAFEYHAMAFRIVRIGSIAATIENPSDSRAAKASDILSNVVCEVVRR